MLDGWEVRLYMITSSCHNVDAPISICGLSWSRKFQGIVDTKHLLYGDDIFLFKKRKRGGNSNMTFVQHTTNPMCSIL